MAKIRVPTANEIEAANRAEATALLIRCGYRVYHPEADCYGEDLVLRTPTGKLRAVQLKSRMTVNQDKYGSTSLWMLFPSTSFNASVRREWFLVPHHLLYKLVKEKHGHSPKFDGEWSCETVPKADWKVLAKFIVAS